HPLRRGHHPRLPLPPARDPAEARHGRGAARQPCGPERGRSGLIGSVAGPFVPEREGDAAMPSPRDLLPEVYDQLRRLAAPKIANARPGQSLDATALVHEAWPRLADAPVDWQDRHPSPRVAATAMRRILVDLARAKRTAKRGGGAIRVEGIEIALPVPDA